MSRKVTFERNMTGSFMQIRSDEPISEIDEKIILKGNLQGLLDTERCTRDGEVQYWYGISGRQSLDTICTISAIGMQIIDRMVLGLCEEAELMERHLLNINCLLLEPEMIFLKNNGREFFFTFFPGNGESLTDQFRNLMEFLLTKLDHKDPKAVEAAYMLYECALEDNYSLQDLKSIILESRMKTDEESAESPEVTEGEKAGIDNESGREAAGREITGREAAGKETAEKAAAGREPAGREIAGKAEEPGKAKEPGKLVMPRREKPVLGKEKKKKKEKEKKQGIAGLLEKILIGSKAEPLSVTPEMSIREEEHIPAPKVHPTVCLTDYEPAPDGILIYQGTGNFSNICLKGEAMTIGYGEEADVWIHKDTVSHLQARVIRNNDDWCIEDLNSTNGTFVNGEALAYKEKRILKMNDIVRFADVKYRFV